MEGKKTMNFAEKPNSKISASANNSLGQMWKYFLAFDYENILILEPSVHLHEHLYYISLFNKSMY